MPQEREPIYCPYCGREMELVCAGDDVWWYSCGIDGCDAIGPSGKSEEEAYQAARQRLKHQQRPMSWNAVMAHVDFLGAKMYEKRFTARPLYLEINPVYKYSMKFARFNLMTFSPWCGGIEILKMLMRFKQAPLLFGAAVRFWRDEPTPEEMAAAPWEEENQE